MFVLKKVITTIVVPPYSFLLFILLGLFLIRRYPRGARLLVTLCVLSIYGLSLPLVSTALMRSLEWYPPIEVAQLKGSSAIVIVGGGTYHEAPEYGGDTIGNSSLERVRYGVHLQRQTDLPILVTGGSPFGGRSEANVMADSIVNDFNGRVVWVESQSRDTFENASLSTEILKNSGVRRVAVVSHAWHLPRVVRFFRAAGLEVLPAPTVFAEDPGSLLEALLPSASSLDESARALREWLGMAVATFY